ncbi:hypothetical protein DFH09DRAFT_1105638 [Mycena vulgaris]|nr:hypothetical protein DFH09DRAFT_1105638 [Mycena vulgaris]
MSPRSPRQPHRNPATPVRGSHEVRYAPHAPEVEERVGEGDPGRGRGGGEVEEDDEGGEGGGEEEVGEGERGEAEIACGGEGGVRGEEGGEGGAPEAEGAEGEDCAGRGGRTTVDAGSEVDEEGPHGGDEVCWEGVEERRVAADVLEDVEAVPVDDLLRHDVERRRRLTHSGAAERPTDAPIMMWIAAMRLIEDAVLSRDGVDELAEAGESEDCRRAPDPHPMQKHVLEFQACRSLKIKSTLAEIPNCETSAANLIRKGS